MLATNSLPRKYADALEPWDLDRLAPYSDEYLSGFVAESYQVDLAGGFEIAKQMMDGPIHQTINQDIGGDHQTIDSVDTRTRHHLQAPAAAGVAERLPSTTAGRSGSWSMRTGEVQGERPYSAVKITLLIVAILSRS